MRQDVVTSNNLRIFSNGEIGANILRDQNMFTKLFSRIAT